MSSAPIPCITWPVPIAVGVNSEFLLAAGPTGLPEMGTDIFSVALPAQGTAISGFGSADYSTPLALVDTLNYLIDHTVAGGSGPLAGSTIAAHGVTAQFVWATPGVLSFEASGFPSPVTTIEVNWGLNSLTRALGTLLGFDVSTGVLQTQPFSLTAPGQIAGYWTPGLPVRSDTRDTSTFARGLVATAGTTAGLSSVYALDLAQQYHRELQFENIPDSRTFVANEGALLNAAIERLWQPTTGSYASFRYYPDRDEETFGTYSLDETTSQEFKPERQYDTVPLYKFGLKMLRIG